MVQQKGTDMSGHITSLGLAFGLGGLPLYKQDLVQSPGRGINAISYLMCILKVVTSNTVVSPTARGCLIYVTFHVQHVHHVTS